jgi:hypothetical protein
VNGELFALTSAEYPFNSNVTSLNGLNPQIHIIVDEYDDLELGLPTSILTGTDDIELL